MMKQRYFLVRAFCMRTFMVQFKRKPVTHTNISVHAPFIITTTWLQNDIKRPIFYNAALLQYGH